MLLIAVIILVVLSGCSRTPETIREAEIGKPLPLWDEGFLDIHAINSGRGECTFIMCPDGTSMVVDAGEFPTSKSRHPMVPQRPDERTRPTGTYGNYIRHFLGAAGRDSIDYMFVTHFHMDHMGKYDKKAYGWSEAGYMLTGVTALYHEIPFRKIVDRAWPDYESCRLEDTNKGVGSYAKFIEHHAETDGLIPERFIVGRDDQFTLVHEPDNYPSFSVRNLCSGGHVWLDGADVDCYEGATLKENGASLGMLISYGDFDYWTCGDADSKKPMELAAARAVGHSIEACKANHHFSWYTMSSAMMEILKPQVIVSQSFYAHQPDISALRNVTLGCPGYEKPAIFLTNLQERTVENYPDITDELAGYQGHVVIRVCPQGKEFYVYVLDDSDFEYRIKSIHGPYFCDEAENWTPRKFISHRGLHLKSSIAGENSLKAVELAVKAGFSSVETDVRMTKDSVLVVMHDSTLNRTCLDSKMRPVAEPVFVRDLSFDELRRNYVLKADLPQDRERIPTLAEYLEKCSQCGVEVFIEPKLKPQDGWFYSQIISCADSLLGRGNYIVTSNNYANEMIRRQMKVGDVRLMGILYQTDFDNIASLGNTIMAVSTTRFSPEDYKVNIAASKDAGMVTESHCDNYKTFSIATDCGTDYISTDKLVPDFHGQGRVRFHSRALDIEGIKKGCEETEIGPGAMYLEMVVKGSAEIILGPEKFSVSCAALTPVRHQVAVPSSESLDFDIVSRSPDFDIASIILRIVEW